MDTAHSPPDQLSFTTERRRVTLSRILLGLSVLLAGSGLAFMSANTDPAAMPGSPWLFIFLAFGLVLSNGLVGLLIVTRYPRHVIGWLLLGVAFNYALGFFGNGMRLLYSAPSASASSFFVTFFAWVAQWVWFPLGGLTNTFIPLYFPDGKLLTRRWRFVVVAGAIALTAGVVSGAIHPGTPSDWGDLPGSNPLKIPGGAALGDFLWQFITLPFTILSILGGIASLLLRYRRVGSVQRSQMKWLFYTVALGFSISFLLDIPYVLSAVGDFRDIAGDLQSVAMPIAIGIAILRYRLYDIDLIIRRTLIYGLVTLLLGLVYFGSVVLLQQLFAGISGQQSPIAIVVSTLVIAALFNPLRNHVQRFINRRFYRSQYDAARTLASFAQTARDEVALETLTVELERVVQETMQPETLSIWLRPAEEEQRSSRLLEPLRVTNG